MITVLDTLGPASGTVVRALPGAGSSPLAVGNGILRGDLRKCDSLSPVHNGCTTHPVAC